MPGGMWNLIIFLAKFYADCVAYEIQLLIYEIRLIPILIIQLFRTGFYKFALFTGVVAGCFQAANIWRLSLAVQAAFVYSTLWTKHTGRIPV